MRYELGIDIGCSQVTVATHRPGGDRDADGTTRVVPLAFPAVVHLDADGRLQGGPGGVPSRAVGDLLHRVGDPTPVPVGDPATGPAFTAPELLAELLRSVVAAVVDREGGTPAAIVLTHPSGWGPYRREQFEEALGRAGLQDSVVASAADVLAARHGAHRDVADGVAVLFCDWGAGSFECTVMRRRTQGWEQLGPSEGVDRLGGDQLDAAVLELLEVRSSGRLHGLVGDAGPEVSARLLAACRTAREDLSTAVNTVVELDVPGSSHRELLTRAEFDRAVRPLLPPLLEAAERALQGAGICADSLAEVVLLGGTARTPLLSNLLERTLGVPVRLVEDPEHELALAAAELAGSVRERAEPAGAVFSEPLSPLDPESPPRTGGESRPRSARSTVVVLGAAAVVVVGGLFLGRALIDPGEGGGGSEVALPGTGSPSTPSPVSATRTPSETSSETSSETNSEEGNPSTIPVGQVQLCAQGTYPAFLRLPAPAAGPDGGGPVGFSTPVVAPGDCWIASVGTGGETVVVEIAGVAADGTTFDLGDQEWVDSEGIGLGTQGSVTGGYIYRW